MHKQNIESDNPTIAAIATGNLRAQLGLIRISGSQSQSIVEQLLRQKLTWCKRRFQAVELMVDPGVYYPARVVYMAGPNSYTGEDVVEVQLPGNPVIMNDVLAAIFRAGAKPAGPGEFTRRAFENDRMDLLQARSVMQLIQAASEAERKQTMAMLEGNASLQYAALADDLLRVTGLLQASLEFNPDEIGEIDGAEIRALLDDLHAACQTQVQAGRHTQISQFPRVLLTGYANTGKSSLFNYLCGQRRSFVSDEIHATRDPIEVLVKMESGQPDSEQDSEYCLVDTAGLQLAVNDFTAGLSQRYETLLAQADVVLYIFDASRDVDQEEINHFLAQQGLRLSILNKVDQAKPETVEKLSHAIGEGMLKISVTHHEGLDKLKDKLAQTMSELSANALAPQMAQTWLEIVERLEEAKTTLAANEPEEFAVVFLQEAYMLLSELRGVEAGDDVLDGVFKRFCIGK